MDIDMMHPAFRPCLQAGFVSAQAVRVMGMNDTICVQLRLKTPIGSRGKNYANDHIASLCITAHEATEMANDLLSLAASVATTEKAPA